MESQWKVLFWRWQVNRHYTAHVFYCHGPVLDSRLAVILQLPVDSTQNGSKYQKDKKLETKVNNIQRLNAAYQKEAKPVVYIWLIQVTDELRVNRNINHKLSSVNSRMIQCIFYYNTVPLISALNIEKLSGCLIITRTASQIKLYSTG